MSSSWTRRAWLETGACLLAAPFLPGPVIASDARVAEILTRSDHDGGRVWFDPIGLWIEPGTTVRWINEANVHTATAYHPANGGRALRIPENAEPWDSGYLVNPGDSFEVTLSEAGVYDYYCAPHEAAGMVGRLIVGEPTGPGSRSFDWFKDEPDRNHWQPVPEAARAAFPSIDDIMETRLVRSVGRAGRHVDEVQPGQRSDPGQGRQNPEPVPAQGAFQSHRAGHRED